MAWSDAQRQNLASEYARIGYVPGERWPAPPPELSPEELLALFARIPDGAGRAGFLDVLAKLRRP